MAVVLTWETVITIGAIIAATTAIVTMVFKFVRWVDRIGVLRKEIELIKKEQQLLVYGILACLRGLKEKGCNGPVTDAIDKIEKHINVEAHKE